MPSTKRQTAFRFKEELLNKLKIEAQKQNRSVNNLVETTLINLYANK